MNYLYGGICRSVVDIVGSYVGDGVGIEVQASDNGAKGIQQMG